MATAEQDQNDSISVGGKFPVKIRGVVGIMAGVIVVLMVAIGWLVNFSLGNWGTPFDIQGSMVMHMKMVEEQHAENAYILAACLNQKRQAECDRLDISVPESLKRKMR